MRHEIRRFCAQKGLVQNFLTVGCHNNSKKLQAPCLNPYSLFETSLIIHYFQLLIPYGNHYQSSTGCL